jgi:hypothetical protein
MLMMDSVQRIDVIPALSVTQGQIYNSRVAEMGDVLPVVIPLRRPRFSLISIGVIATPFSWPKKNSKYRRHLSRKRTSSL